VNPLAWMCIALGVMLFIQTIRQWRSERTLESTRKTSSRLIAGLHADLNELKRRDQVESYNALEKGMDEQNEAWEVELLSWREKEERFEYKIAELQVDVAWLLSLGWGLKNLSDEDVERIERINKRLLSEGGRKNTP
jgi:hypothetical protein